MQRNLMWFRNDLRVRDNPALWHAGDSGVVIGLYVLTPEQWRRHQMAACRVDFILRTLEVLRADLNGLGIPLIVIEGMSFSAIPEIIAEFCHSHGISRAFWNREYPLDEVRRDDAVERVLDRAAIDVSSYHDRAIVAPGALVKDDGSAYKVFTPFKKTWLRLLDEGLPDVFPAPRRQAMPLAVGQLDIPRSIPGFTSSIDQALWPAGESEARQRLKSFADSALNSYQKNRDLPAVSGTSTLSPYLAVGALSPQQCLMEALMANPGEGVDTWIGELVWRDFYQHIVWHFPRVSKHKPFKSETDAVPWRYDQRDFLAWCEGKTGVPLVDAGMRQLAQTGWMHNRVRMVVAMFLSKNLLIDWRWGEGFFMENLIDGDFAANNGGWQWSASTGTDAVPYFRIFNPFTQGQRFDPNGDYIKHYISELSCLSAREIHEPKYLRQCKPGGYPDVIVNIADSRQRAMAAFKSLAF